MNSCFGQLLHISPSPLENPTRPDKRNVHPRAPDGQDQEPPVRAGWDWIFEGDQNRKSRHVQNHNMWAGTNGIARGCTDRLQQAQAYQFAVLHFADKLRHHNVRKYRTQRQSYRIAYSNCDAGPATNRARRAHRFRMTGLTSHHNTVHWMGRCLNNHSAHLHLRPPAAALVPSTHQPTQHHRAYHHHNRHGTRAPTRACARRRVHGPTRRQSLANRKASCAKPASGSSSSARRLTSASAWMRATSASSDAKLASGRT